MSKTSAKGILALLTIAVIVVLGYTLTPSSRTEADPYPATGISGFLTRQKAYQRIRQAFADKEQLVNSNLRSNGFAPDSIHILIVAYKAEKQLKIHAKHKSGTVYREIASYDICRSSGKLGPKRQQGDKQVPEGFYHIDRFNPASNFYLSLGINYPNLSDRKKSRAAKPGGDIFIHGSCVTVGCLPMTDDKIKEIYLYAVYARNNGQTEIPVYIFPFKMTDEAFDKHREKQEQELVAFWTNLKTGFDMFEKERTVLMVSVDENGDYRY
jgi:murein L,D-transpeptidase YafK